MKTRKGICLFLVLVLVTGLLGGCRNKKNDAGTEGSTENPANQATGIQDMTSTAADHTENGTDDTFTGTVTGTEDGGLMDDISSGLDDLGDDMSKGLSDAEDNMSGSTEERGSTAAGGGTTKNP